MGFFLSRFRGLNWTVNVKSKEVKHLLCICEFSLHELSCTGTFKCYYSGFGEQICTQTAFFFPAVKGCGVVFFKFFFFSISRGLRWNLKKMEGTVGSAL